MLKVSGTEEMAVKHTRMQATEKHVTNHEMQSQGWERWEDSSYRRIVTDS